MEQLQQVLSTPPPNWQPPPGAAPESIAILCLHASLEHLRKTGDEQYLFLRATLELLTNHGFLGGSDSTAATANDNPTKLSGDEEQLLFHCVTGVRHVMLFRWEYFQPSFRSCVRDCLLAIGLGCYKRASATGSVALPRTFTLACLSSAASFWKREWTVGAASNDTTRVQQQDSQQNYWESLMTTNLMPSMQRCNGTDGLFTYLNSLLISPFEQSLQPMELMSRQYTGTMAASFLSLLVGEFTGGNSSARYNLPTEFHRLCHQVFENGNEEAGVSASSKSGLDATLLLSMSALSSFVSFMLNTESSNNEAINNEALLDLGISTVSLTFDVLSWEFGASSSKWDFSNGSTKKDGSSVLLRPPQRWREALINPEFLGAIFRVYTSVRVGSQHSLPRSLEEKRGRMAHQLRQLLLQLSSIAGGPIFADENERGAYAGFLLDGCLDALEIILTENQQQRGRSTEESDFKSTEVIDLVTMLNRLATNFRVQTLSQLASFPRFLSAMAMVGKWLLEGSLAECERVQGDLESMEGLQWKYDGVSQILQCSEAMADDYWLVSGDAQTASDNLANILAPLYSHYVACRVRMSSLEEHYATQQEEDLDEIGEEIWAFGLEEEMVSAASLGRLNISVSLTILAGMLQQCVPRLMSLFEGAGNGSDMTAVMAALLEEARMLILCACHLLTDECEGETPSLPDAVCNACQLERASGNDCLASIVNLVELLRSVAEAQAMKVSAHPTESSLSPLLAKTLLWFFRRWSAVYVLPVSENYHREGIFARWSTPESASPIISFCATLSLIYFCHWPQEREVQDESTALLLILAKKGSFVRQLMVVSPSFQQIAALHSICASLRHNASHAEIIASMSSVGGNLSVEAVRGYQRLPYNDRARVLTCLVVGCSDMDNEKSNAMLDGCLKAVSNHFWALAEALR